jgi:hypothetical protein
MSMSDNLRCPFPFATADAPFVIGCGIMFGVATVDAPFGPPVLLGSLYVTDPEEFVLTAPLEPDTLVEEDGVWWLLVCVAPV